MSLLKEVALVLGSLAVAVLLFIAVLVVGYHSNTKKDSVDPCASIDISTKEGREEKNYCEVGKCVKEGRCK